MSFHGARCSTISVENGRAALDLMRGDPDRISLVLADIIMPVMDGIELLHIVKVVGVCWLSVATYLRTFVIAVAAVAVPR